jgi:hypothetical protein
VPALTWADSSSSLDCCCSLLEIDLLLRCEEGRNMALEEDLPAASGLEGQQSPEASSPSASSSMRWDMERKLEGGRGGRVEVGVAEGRLGLPTSELAAEGLLAPTAAALAAATLRATSPLRMALGPPAGGAPPDGESAPPDPGLLFALFFASCSSSSLCCASATSAACCWAAWAAS